MEQIDETRTAFASLRPIETEALHRAVARANEMAAKFSGPAASEDARAAAEALNRSLEGNHV